MILFQNWNIEYIGGLFARQYDNLSRTLEVTGVPEGYDYRMMVQVGENFDILSLSPMEGGVGVVLTANQLSIAGYYKLQLVGTLRSDGVTKRHTNVLQVYVPGSLSGDANWPTVPSEFSQVEANIRELNSHPPIPGDNGYWLTWDLESHGYTESEFPLPEVPAGPAGADGTTFTPSVSASGILSWTNNGGLENPAPVDIRGPAGKDGEQGPAGEDGLGLPAATAEDAGKVPVVQADGSYGLVSMIPAPETAEVGQTIVVKAVDENGKPTEWEVADIVIFPKWETIVSDMTTGEVQTVEVFKTDDGEDFAYNEIFIKGISFGHTVDNTVKNTSIYVKYNEAWVRLCTIKLSDYTREKTILLKIAEFGGTYNAEFVNSGSNSNPEVTAARQGFAYGANLNANVKITGIKISMPSGITFYENAKLSISGRNVE